MIYEISLPTAGLAVGLLLLIAHAFALCREKQASLWAKEFPRSRLWATILLGLAMIWVFWLVRTMDLGEFSSLRIPMLWAIVIGGVLSWLYVEEFLAVRALGILLLLGAEPVLEAAALRDESTRLLLVVLAYVWIAAGLFFVGKPYLLRNFIHWITSCSQRWKTASMVGVAWGLAVLACAVFLW